MTLGRSEELKSGGGIEDDVKDREFSPPLLFRQRKSLVSHSSCSTVLVGGWDSVSWLCGCIIQNLIAPFFLRRLSLIINSTNRSASQGYHLRLQCRLNLSLHIHSLHQIQDRGEVRFIASGSSNIWPRVVA